MKQQLFDEKFPHLPSSPIVESVIQWTARSSFGSHEQAWQKPLKERLPEFPTSFPVHSQSIDTMIVADGSPQQTAKTRITTGFSDAARTVSQSIEAQSSGLRCSETFGLDSQLREELAEVWGECHEPNWDGYRSLPISRETLRQVYHLLEEIPSSIPAPSLSAHPDGAIAMEWY